MSQNTSHKITGNASANLNGTQKVVPPYGSDDKAPADETSQALIQCLLIAARRGRQLRLAREQAAQKQPSEILSTSDEQTLA